MKPLRIPYAIDLETNRRISADEIAEMMTDPRSTIRLRATASKDTLARKALRLSCPACSQQLYPHAPRLSEARYFWSHLPRQARFCPLESKGKLSPDQVNSRIFDGREESNAHKDLVALLMRYAASDPQIEAETVVSGAYEPPRPEIRVEFPYGRFPDVKFAFGMTSVVLEAQLATITLHGINGRRAFYDRSDIRLLWVMRNFDPTGTLRASVRDIIADQAGMLYSIDHEVEAAIAADRRFRLRVWAYQAVDDSWSDRIELIENCIALARPQRWADTFKARWIEAYGGRNYRDVQDPRVEAMLAEVVEHAQIDTSEIIPNSMLPLIRLLISLESGTVAGSGHRSLISIANSFDFNDGHRALALVRKAIERWQPAVLNRNSVGEALARAQATLDRTGDKEWGRRSVLGRIREALFPDWRL
jgi:hypothetical protein